MEHKNDVNVKGDMIRNDFGSIRISEEVITSIAAKAASEIEDLAAMGGGIKQGIAERLGRKDLSKGLKVRVEEREVQIDLNIIVNYGTPIPEIASNIQKNMKELVEKMTGLSVTQVNINVQGLNFLEENTELEK